MDSQEQASTLKEIVPRLLRDVADLQLRVKALEGERDDTLDGSIDGLEDVTLRVQVQTPGEHTTAKAVRWGKATRTPAVRYEYDEGTGETRAYQNSGGKLEVGPVWEAGGTDEPERTA